MEYRLPPMPEHVGEENHGPAQQPVKLYDGEQMQAYTIAAIEQGVPDGLSDDDLSELAHSANQESLSFGLGHDLFLRYFRTLRNRALASASPAPQASGYGPKLMPQVSGFDQTNAVQQQPVMIYHGACTIDCGEHGHHNVELLKMIPAGSHLYTHPAQQTKPQPLSDEQERALCEAYCNAASDEYFKARPQLDSDVNRRIFYAGHRKAWIEYDAAHGIKGS